MGTGTQFAGNILALISITSTTSAANTGSLYALNGAVTLDTNKIAACGTPPPPVFFPQFAVGDGNAAINQAVTFWGAQWSKDNTLSGGNTPASFKGYVGTTTQPLTCGQTWTAKPGNSGHPPEKVPDFMPVIVSSNITKHGDTITGDIVKIVSVKTDPGYSGNPGHKGTGKVIEVICSP